jgi:acetyl esterase
VLPVDLPALQARVEPVVLRAVLGLPPRALRLLAGRPVVRDGQTLDLETQLLLRLQRLAGRGELDFGPDSRAGIDADARAVGGVQPVGEVRTLRVGGADGDLPARLYVPQRSVTSRSGDPLLVFFHGGGFVAGSLDSHDASCRVLAERAGVRVLSVGYRLAPEHRYPAAPRDCIATYQWVVDHAADVGADPARIAVGGDSAGGNLAAVVAIEAARSGLPLAFQLLVYPVTDVAADTESRRLFSAGFFLTRSAMDQATAHYLGDRTGGADVDPMVSPLHADIPASLAPAYVATAGFDPLRDEGEAYARKLSDAGVPVVQRRFSGQIHSFFNAVGVGHSPRAAVEEIADALADGLRAAAVS